VRSIAPLTLLVALGILFSSIPGAMSAQVAPTFEVASVRLNTSGDERFSWSDVSRPGLVRITNAPLRNIIGLAFRVSLIVERFSLVGGPDEILSKRFDIAATAPDGAPPAQKFLMLRTLLTERFKLQIRTETRQVDVYALTVLRQGKLGEQLRRSEHDCETFRQARRKDQSLVEPRAIDGDLLCSNSLEYHKPGPGALRMRYAGPLGVLISRLQPRLDRPVVDQTGLSGNFDWVLSFSMNTESFDSAAPSMFTAVQEQLGLKLEARKGPWEVLVIDSVDMPAPN
jgi:uncharacterized protein (TIGR03435 family)